MAPADQDEAAQAVACWSCAHQQIGGTAFLGYCREPEARGEAKVEIAGAVVDVGCPLWRRR